MKIVFLNISYFVEGCPTGYSKYIKDNEAAVEKYNFETISINSKNYCAGFFEAGYSSSGYDPKKRKQVHIEKIDSTFKNQPYGTGIIAVWCALHPTLKKTMIIGWYKNAKLFRNSPDEQGILKNKITSRKKFEEALKNEVAWRYNVLAVADDCTKLPDSEITANISKWEAHRSRQDGFGFGQSNIWYADKKTEIANAYVDSVIENISTYDGDNSLIICDDYCEQEKQIFKECVDISGI